MFGLLDYLKLGIGAVAGAALMATPAYFYGKSAERASAQIEQSKIALARIKTLEKNNADFNSLPDRDRCLVFMRDSGLPDAACD